MFDPLNIALIVAIVICSILYIYARKKGNKELSILAYKALVFSIESIVLQMDTKKRELKESNCFDEEAKRSLKQEAIKLVKEKVGSSNYEESLIGTLIERQVKKIKEDNDAKQTIS